MVCCPSELNIHYPYSFVYFLFILCIFYLFLLCFCFLFLSRSWKLTKPKDNNRKKKKNRRETKRKKKKKQICNKCSSFSRKVIIYLYSTTLPLFNKSVYIHYLLNIYYTFLLIVIEHILKN